MVGLQGVDGVALMFCRVHWGCEGGSVGGEGERRGGKSGVKGEGVLRGCKDETFSLLECER